MTGLVDSYLGKLQRRRRERAAQMDPIRGGALPGGDGEREEGFGG